MFLNDGSTMNAQVSQSQNSTNRAQHYALGACALIAHVVSISPFASLLQYDRFNLFVTLALYFVCFGFLLSAIETIFFFEGAGPVRAKHWLGGIAYFIMVAGITSLLVPGNEAKAGLVEAIIAWSNRESWDAMFSIAYATIAFMVTYCVIGSATWPFVRSYYKGATSGLALRVPSGRVVILLQLFRGFLATLVLVPMFAGLEENVASVRTLACLVFSLTITMAVVPMFWVRDWPLRLRIIHGVEISLFAAIQGTAWWYFLGQ
jgi:hypothetical protein